MYLLEIVFRYRFYRFFCGVFNYEKMIHLLTHSISEKSNAYEVLKEFYR